MLLRSFAIVLASSAIGCASGATAASGALLDSPEDARSEDVVPSDGGADDRAPNAEGDAAADAAGALEIFPAQFTEEQMPMRMLAAGDPVDLWNAPQGGHVVLLGAKVKNLLSDTVMLKVRFRQPDGTRIIVAEEGRTVKMVPVPDEPGMMQPDIRSRSQVSNVPLCPSYGTFGIVDRPFDVEVSITALYTDPVQTGTTTLSVVARCSTPDDEAFCRCECESNYFLGKCGDDGATDAQPPKRETSDASGSPDADVE